MWSRYLPARVQEVAVGQHRRDRGRDRAARGGEREIAFKVVQIRLPERTVGRAGVARRFNS